MKSKSHYRLIATDLDGTLLGDDKRISDHTRETLIRAQQQGIRVVLSTGRPLEGVLPHAATLRLREYGGFIIAFNGSLLYDCEADATLYSQTIDPMYFSFLREKAAEGFCLVSYKDGCIATEHPDNQYAKYLGSINRMPVIKLNNFSEEIDFPECKCIIAGNPRRLWHLERNLQRQLAGQLHAFRSESFLLEIVPLGIDKAATLGRLLSYLDLTPSQIVSFGDGFNDLPMLQMSGLSVAMANAKRQIRETADLQAPSNNQDGVAAIVEQYLL